MAPELTELAAEATAALPILLTSDEVAAILRVNRSTLSRWRAAGVGPRVTWLAPTIPRYQRTDIFAWLQQVAA